MRKAAPTSSLFKSSRIAVVITVTGVLLLCLLTYLCLDGLFLFYSSSSHHEACSVSCDSSGTIYKLKSELVSMSDKNARLEKQVKHLYLVNRRKAGPFGSVKGSITNPSVTPDESINPRLANILKIVSINNELIVSLANSHVRDLLLIWIESIKRVGILNYLVVALDDYTENFCKSKHVPGDTIAVSGLKFTVLREFLQLGYSVLLSDIDIVYLQNPIDHLYRDLDIESMSDGFSNRTSYGFINVENLGVYSGFFYIRPTFSSIELLDRVSKIMFDYPKAWDQQIFNELLFYPSHVGYVGVHASKRTMDFFKFMNSYVLFKFVRKEAKLRKLKPVIVHVNYHPDKLARMKAVVDFYVNGKKNAFDPFTDGTPRLKFLAMGYMALN
ncbi:putative nucleotide-diphospho-sugar transferase, arabinosyltransferase R [Dioscorea sansibarensis]